MRLITRLFPALALILGLAATAVADPFLFTTGNPDGRMATATRPQSDDKIEIESADDFVLSSHTVLYGAVFTGLLPAGVRDIGIVKVEIYRVFPNDSDTNRTPNVPTRTNSPADVEFAEASRTTEDGSLAYISNVLQYQFPVGNSVIKGIYPSPGQNTGGDGPVSGDLTQIVVLFVHPIDLPADHYFFVPQVEVTGDQGDFLWASAAHPQFTGDLQMWIRNSDLDPDWLRVGADIVGGTTFNGSFSLIGETLPN
jgi:hypothetical protein